MGSDFVCMDGLAYLGRNSKFFAGRKINTHTDVHLSFVAFVKLLNVKESL